MFLTGIPLPLNVIRKRVLL